MPADNYQSEPDPDQGPTEALRLPSLPQRLQILERISAESICDPLVSSYRNRAQFTFFCGAEPAEMGGHDGQLEVVGRCLEWFVFDYDIPELDTTPANYWLQCHADDLSDDQIADAQTCLDFVLGLFEITQIKPGHSFVARDLLRPSLRYTVFEELITNEIHPHQLLLGRLFPYRSDYVLSGMAGIMDAHATGQIKSLINIGKLKPDVVLPTLDGVELENLFGRSVHDLADITDLKIIHHRLRRYLEILPDCPITFSDLRRLIAAAEDPLELAANLTRQFQIFCRHEMDLLFTLISAAWNLSQNN
ncbi:MAG: hypothetical protein GY869_26485 [Planctomycetes bacterium]|nr:hypothetical protein [Planctomycetota bacterium]